mgnify:CR=1 FL=1
MVGTTHGVRDVLKEQLAAARQTRRSNKENGGIVRKALKASNAVQLELV